MPNIAFRDKLQSAVRYACGEFMKIEGLILVRDIVVVQIVVGGLLNLTGKTTMKIKITYCVM